MLVTILYCLRKARGKQPRLSGWTNWKVEQATDTVFEQHFGNGYDANLGIVVRPPHVCVDLDSKSDKGASVLAFLQTHPELTNIPRERTAGGLHLHFTCNDLPAITKSDRPYKHALVSELDDKVTAELYFDGLNLVVSPSIHASGVPYTWAEVGEIPVVTWAQLQQWFGFQLPDGKQPNSSPKRERSKQPKEWWHQYDGDLRTLDLAKLFRGANRLGETINAEKQIISVQCPWHSEHSGGDKAWKPNDSSTVIVTALGEHVFPGFKCQHSHCEKRCLKEVLEWFEAQTPGIVDRHCTRRWAYEPGQRAEDGRPRVVLPGDNRPDSKFAEEEGRILASKNAWFVKGEDDGGHRCAVSPTPRAWPVDA